MRATARVDGSGLPDDDSAVRACGSTIIPCDRAYYSGNPGPEFIRTVPGETGASRRKVEGNLNGDRRVREEGDPGDRGLKELEPEAVALPNEKLPEAKLEGCPVA